MSNVKSVLSIAGSDSSGGAGVQADIKTIESLGLFATCAITAITAQNTCGVRSVQDVDASVIADQIDAVFEDIRPDAVKIGMVSSAQIIDVIADRLQYWDARRVVVDPVMVATSGARLIGEDALSALREKLLPLACIITPNIPEAQMLSDRRIDNDEDALRVGEALAQEIGTSVLIKGGHRRGAADDLLVDSKGSPLWLRASRIPNENSHGTGCTLSSAIACGLARGFDVTASVRQAKAFVRGAMSSGLDLGQGSGPLDHMWCHEEPDIRFDLN